MICVVLWEEFVVVEGVGGIIVDLLLVWFEVDWY